jgi:hypothetical protein
MYVREEGAGCGGTACKQESKEVFTYENDLSAEEKAEKERAWLQKENEDKKRQKCAQEKKSTRKKEAVRLRYKEC